MAVLRGMSTPPEPGSSHRQGHVPLLGFGALGAEQPAALVSLVGGLACDLESSADVGPTGSLGTGGSDHENCCLVQRVAGVSEPLEVDQRPLRAGQGCLESLHPSGHMPTSMAAFWGAHVNRWCHQKWRPAAGCSSIGIGTGIAPELVLAVVSTSYLDGPVVGAPGTARPLISSYISRREHPNGSLQKKIDPRDVGASGGRDHHDGMSVWRP